MGLVKGFQTEVRPSDSPWQNAFRSPFGPRRRKPNFGGSGRLPFYRKRGAVIVGDLLISDSRGWERGLEEGVPLGRDGTNTPSLVL